MHQVLLLLLRLFLFLISSLYYVSPEGHKNKSECMELPVWQESLKKGSRITLEEPEAGAFADVWRVWEGLEAQGNVVRGSDIQLHLAGEQEFFKQIKDWPVHKAFKELQEGWCRVKCTCCKVAADEGSCSQKAPHVLQCGTWTPANRRLEATGRLQMQKGRQSY